MKREKQIGESRLDEIDQRLERSRFAFCYVYDSRNTRICRSALTAIFRQRAIRRAIRIKRVIGLGAKPAGFRCSFHILARLDTDEKALPYRCDARPPSIGPMMRANFSFVVCLFLSTFMFDFSFPREAWAIR